jgi:hypothetical protein
VWCKEDPDAFLLHPDCYAPLKTAWMNGEAFFTGRDAYGDEVIVKLGQVVAISRATPEAMAEAAEDAKADKLAGGD